MIKIIQSSLRDLDKLSLEHFEHLEIFIIERILYCLDPEVHPKPHKGKNNIDKKIQKLNATHLRKLKLVCRYLLEKNENDIYINLKKILLCKPKEFTKMHKDELPEHAGLKEVLKQIFSYDVFRDGIFSKTETRTNWNRNPDNITKKPYSAHELIKALNIPVCPYCNRLYITDIEDTKKTLKPDLDHFYPRSKHPVFGLSFYNLIPSCTVCNSRLKGDKPFTTESHIHPYNEGFGNDAVFNYHGSPSKGNITIITKDVKSGKKDRIDKSTRDLLTLTLYKTHSDIAKEIYDKTLNNSEDHFESLKDIFRDIPTCEVHEKLPLSAEEFYQFYFGNYMNPNDFEKRPLAKFNYALIEELGIMYMSCF